MDLRQVRIDIRAVIAVCGYNAWDYEPDDPQDLPAGVVDGIESLIRMNRLVTAVKIGVTFYVNNADPKDATAKLDLTLSTGFTNSYVDALDAASLAGASWRSIRLEGAEAYHRVAMPGGGVALACRTITDLTA